MPLTGWTQKGRSAPPRRSGTSGERERARASMPGRRILQRGRLEEIDHRQLHPEGGVDADHHLHRQQRVAAQLEEVVPRPQRLGSPSSSRHRSRQRCLLGAAGREAARAAALALRRRAAPRDPPCRWALSGSAASSTKPAGTMCSGSRARRKARRAAAAPGRPRAGRRRPPAACRPRSASRATTTPRGRPDAAQRRLHLAQLHAEAADLHLAIAPAQELQPAVGAASARDPRCGTAGRRALANGSGTKRSAVSAGRPR